MTLETRINGGNSKDTLSLVMSDAILEVVKIFRSNTARARKNIQKQTDFRDLNINLISLKSCPVSHSILQDETSPCLRVTMPYIDGIVASDFALNAGFKLVQNLNIIIESYLKNILKTSLDIEFPSKIYLDKLKDIAEIAPNRFLKYVYFAEKLIKNNRGRHLSGTCHGDFTLSNIICESENIFYLIDFLQTFDESPLQDMSKLLQERKYGWSFRKSINPVANRGRIFCHKSIPDPYKILPKRYHASLEICEILTLLRIIPYLTDEQTTVWLEYALSQFMREFYL